MGIFGFLSNSYMGATVEFDTMLTKLEVYEEQLETMEEDKVFLKQELEQSVNALPDNYVTAKRKIREEYNPLIQEKSVLIGDLKNKIGELKIEMVDTGIDVGPLLYIADAFDTDMDTAVKWIMFILILVFDPLAVIMIIGFNVALLDGKRRPSENDGKKYKVYQPTPKVYTSLDNPTRDELEKEDKPSNPLEAWQKETEKKIEDEGMVMGNEGPSDSSKTKSFS